MVLECGTVFEIWKNVGSIWKCSATLMFFFFQKILRIVRLPNFIRL